MLAALATEYGFTVYEVDADSPAGRRLAQVSRLPQLPGVYIDLDLVAWGRPTPDELRQAIARGLHAPAPGAIGPGA